MVGSNTDSQRLHRRKGGSATLDLGSSYKPTQCASESKGRVKKESEMKRFVRIVTEPLWNRKKPEIGGGDDVSSVLNRDGEGLWVGYTYPGFDDRGGHGRRARLGGPGRTRGINSFDHPALARVFGSLSIRG
jgi:hypothetical protein